LYKINSLFNSKYIIGLCILISRITGLLRELFIAYMFGVGVSSDVVNTALKLPNLFRRIFGEGALSSVFIPEYTKRRLKSEIDSKKFASQIFSILFITLSVVVVLMQVFMPYLIYLISPGFSFETNKLKLAILLSRITIPYLIFISACALLGGMLNSIGKYAAFAFAPVLLNLVIIVFTILTIDFLDPIIAISISILLAGILQLAFIYLFVKFYGISFRLSLPKVNEDTRIFMKRLFPAIISSGAVQLSIFISHSIASFFPGAISILSYSDRIYQLPLSMIGVTLSTVFLSELSSLYQKQKKKEIFIKQNNYIKLASLLAFPCSFGIYSIAHPLIYIIYQRGAFTELDTATTANILCLFDIGLPAFILNKILMQIFYANSDTKTPMNITIYSLLVNMILNVMFIVKFDYFGIALGTSIAAWVSVAIQITYLNRYNLINIDRSTYLYISKSILMSTLMCLIVNFSLNYTLPMIYNNPNIISKILGLSLSIIIGLSSYFLMCFICGMLKKEKNIS
jgi:putative peptidoglycan lipid II flippase